MIPDLPSIELQGHEERNKSMGPFIALAIKKHHTDMQITLMETYNNELESKFKKDLNDTIKYYSGKLSEAENDPTIAEQIDEMLFYDKEAIYEFVKTSRYSSLVNLFSFLETSLNKLCLIVRRAKKLDLSPEDLRHQGVTRSQVYLEKVCSINFPSEGNDWQQIKKLNSVRNQIVHEQGLIRDVKKNPGKRILNIVNKTVGLSMGQNYSVVVEEDYFPKIIVNIKNLLDAVYKETRKSLKAMGEESSKI